MKKTPSRASAPRGRGRPRAERKLVKLIAYLDAAERARVAKAARKAGARSVSSWAAAVLEREARRELRTGEVPEWVLDMPSIPDPEGSIRKAVREERDSGY